MLLITAWVASHRRNIHLSFGTSGLALYVGEIRCWFASEAIPTGVLIEPVDEFYQFRNGGYRYPGLSGAVVPIWMLLLPAALVTAWLCRTDRRPKTGCAKCGYNQTGNVSGVCPECGETICL